MLSLAQEMRDADILRLERSQMCLEDLSARSRGIEAAVRTHIDNAKVMQEKLDHCQRSRDAYRYHFQYNHLTLSTSSAIL